MGASTGQRWPGAIIPYTIGAGFTDIGVLNSAFAAWESVTNLRFRRRLPIQADFIEVQNAAQSCSSKVGRAGGRQTVGCAPFGFGVDSLIHELGHAAGLIHEQSRSDRNDFVTINTANIQSGEGHNFQRIAGSRNGSPYDFRSIMHYGADAFSNGGGPTITPLVAGTVLNGSRFPTPSDIAWINAEYPNLGVVRRSDSSATGAGEIGALATAPFAGNTDRLMTAVRAGNGRLLLLRWRISALGGVGREADSGNQAGEASHIAIARCTTVDRFVTAVRSGSGNLLLISWDATGDGVQRQRDSGNQAGAATLNRIIALTNTTFVTASRDAHGNLILISWRVGADGTITRIPLANSAAVAGSVSDISLVKVSSADPNHLIATTVKAGGGRVLVILWRVNASTGAITRLDDSGNAIGEGSAIGTTMSPSGHLVVSCQSAPPARRLLVISLRVSPDGATITRVADSGEAAGRIGRNALTASSNGVVSAVSAANGSLLLIKWSVDAAGRIRRTGDSGSEAGFAGLLDIVRVPATADAPIVTPVRTQAGALQVISWDDNSAAGDLTR